MSVLCWFSCGATSAVASKLAVQKYKNDLRIIYCDTGGEHPDNKRFLKDIEGWLGQKIEIVKNPKYKDHWDVFEKTKYLVGVQGARCTIELKKKMREQIQQPDDVHIFGFSVEEKHRINKIKQNFPELKTDFILIKNNLSKPNCMAILSNANIKLPVMYKLGYGHNNCIGCPKGGMGYWNKIRNDFPDAFNRMAKIERELNISINRRFINNKTERIFLDELTLEMGREEKPKDIECSLFCQMTIERMKDGH